MHEELPQHVTAPPAKSYQRMTLVEKRAVDLSRVRERALVCDCGVQVMPADMLAHRRERCSGRPEPTVGDVWIEWADALAEGVAKDTLSRWVKDGHVRVQGSRGNRKYLRRDLIDILRRGGPPRRR